MLKHRIIPTLLYDGSHCVKPVYFGRPYRKLGTIEQYIRVIERRNVDELILLDIEASPSGRQPRCEEIRELTSNLFCPVSYGGGIQCLDDIQNVLANGADKVVIKSNLGIINEAAKKFGSQAIVVAIDSIQGKWDLDTNCYAWEIAKRVEHEGAGEIIATDKERDGTFSGYNIDLVYSISSSVSIPVIANGGASNPSDMILAIENGASAVAAGSLFLYTEYTPRYCAKELDQTGIPVRLHG